jgi:hypothetical protein
MLKRCLTFILPLAIALGAPAAIAQEPASTKPIISRHVIGLKGVKHDTNGLLFIEHDEIHFDAGKTRATLSIASIEDIFIGSETTQAGGKMGDVAQGAAMAAPYDSGAAVTLLLRQKVDVLTVTYRDPTGGLHAAIFALPKNRATQFRADLIAAGAHPANGYFAIQGPGVIQTLSAGAPMNPPTPSPSALFRGSPVLIDPIGFDVRVPAEFRFAIYEAMVEQVTNSGVFSKVYRSGDHQAENIPGLVTLHTDMDKFKQGNQTERELITVMGATKITVTVSLTRLGGANVAAYRVEGKVRFFGENLDVTRDLAKRIAKLLDKNS